MYHYETLGDEAFQQFCQALISASFPNAQCLPVGQPDGGRDAYMIRHYLSSKANRQSERDLIVFQVKFVKSPADKRSEREMIEEIVKREKPKVEKLRAAGMTKYYLLTNLRGTAHPDTGSIDRVNNELSKLLGIEAFCWWRDDLDRRLDNNSSIKWSFPTVLKATDLLERLVSGLLGEAEERRKSAIKAYLVSQYDDDQELKFKQTDLRSTMSELFVDLPMRQSFHFDEQARIRDHRVAMSRRNMRVWSDREVLIGYGDNVHSSADYFLGASEDAWQARIVLEGAPGQGKSTVTQYICQIMRMQLLNKAHDLSLQPKQYAGVRVRIPFRVDLRDLAKWISGVDPFQSKQVPLDESEPRSLEGFLAGQVRSLSGGHDFSVSDLSAIARASHILLALDGFDEVAEVSLRQQLVDEITKGVNRLLVAGGYSVQAIVTSRPAAFAKSVRFPRDQWSYFELLPLERRHIDEYTAKWTKAKGLKSGDQSQLKVLLDTKLREPHTQFLAKNPMQLTILLSLIHTRGASLPEKRTAMYDSYMDMFFSRESEKSPVVRDNRDLLIDIHRYLAWRLQTAAEAGENGSIEQSALRTALFAYLDKEGEDTSIVDALFNGIIERVGALVSRVQETYEFEVQPLREYFAARHLYETAPYPSDEKPCTGDKFGRFSALIRNPYWLNVARFYGGCFNKGELLTLVSELKELGDADEYKLTSHTQVIATMFLADWVFSQYQPAVKEVMSYISAYPAVRRLLANFEEGGVSYWSGLPERSGKAELLDAFWKQLLQMSPPDEQTAFSNAINQNSELEERAARWIAAKPKLTHIAWVKLGGLLKMFDEGDYRLLASAESPLTEESVERLVLSRRFDILDRPELSEIAIGLILSDCRGASFLPEKTPRYRVEAIANICAAFQYGLALTDDGMPLRLSIERRVAHGRPSRKRKLIEFDLNSLPPGERDAAAAHEAFLDVETAFTATTLEPWNNLVSVLQKTWGNNAAIDRIAFLGAGIRSKDEPGSDVALDSPGELVRAARFARLKSGAPRWWEQRLSAEQESSEVRRLLLLLLMWGTLKTIGKLLPLLEARLNQLSDADWLTLTRDFYGLQVFIKDEQSDLDGSTIASFKKLSSRGMMFVGLRLTHSDKATLAHAIASRDDTLEAPQVHFAMNAILRSCREPTKWKPSSKAIKRLYATGLTGLNRVERDITMPTGVAQDISRNLQNFPLSVVALADNQLRTVAGSHAPKLLEVAKSEHWFG